MEFHPRIDPSNLILEDAKVILGSFPTWTLSTSHPLDKELERAKKAEQIKNGDIPFFYGSSKNKFWAWYKKFFDSTIELKNIPSIQDSLRKKNVSITDVIINCERRGKSALDKDLKNRTYNHNFIKIPRENESIKILCTSKGVMNEMLLNDLFFNRYKEMKIDRTKSDDFQKRVIKKLNGDKSLVTNPFFQHISVEKGGTIECCSIPSPGSPYRKLSTFGLKTNSPSEFLGNYLKIVFEWFKSK